MLHNEVYCTAPWKGVAIMQDGSVRSCCNGLTELGNLNQSSIEEIVESNVVEQLKQDLINGVKNKNCARCHTSEESTNFATLRQHYLKYYPLDSLEDNELNVIDIRWNNKCNLSCQYCGPEVSSTWETKLGLPLSSVNQTYQDDVLDWVLERSDQLREIMLAGGETMLMKQNYKLFKHAPMKSKFTIVTNLSYDLEHLPCIPDLIRRPKDNIIWTISAENTHKQFEYVRNGASWDLLVKNIKFLLKHWPHSVGLNIVYSVLCATELDKTYKTFSELGVNKVTIIPIFRNDELSINRMPESVRALSKQSLERVMQYRLEKFGEDQPLYPFNGLDSVYQSLTMPTNQATISKQQFDQKISSFDSWSSVGKFSDHWPELADLLNQELK